MHEMCSITVKRCDVIYLLVLLELSLIGFLQLVLDHIGVHLAREQFLNGHMLHPHQYMVTWGQIS